MVLVPSGRVVEKRYSCCQPVHGLLFTFHRIQSSFIRSRSSDEQDGLNVKIVCVSPDDGSIPKQAVGGRFGWMTVMSQRTAAPSKPWLSTALTSNQQLQALLYLSWAEVEKWSCQVWLTESRIRYFWIVSLASGSAPCQMTVKTSPEFLVIVVEVIGV